MNFNIYTGISELFSQNTKVLTDFTAALTNGLAEQP